MKRFLLIMSISILALGFSSCDNSDDPAPAALGTLQVDVTYTGAVQDAEKPGTRFVYVYVYEAMTDSAQDTPFIQGNSGAAVTVGEEATITIDGIAPGDYKVVIIYDYRAHNSNLAGNGDRFIIYDNQSDPANANTVTIESDTIEPLTVSFGDDYKLLSDGAYIAAVK